MSNKAFDMTDALGEMDDALVSEAAAASAKPHVNRLPWLIAAAAALAIVIGAAVILPGLLRHGTGEQCSLVPTEDPASEPPEITNAPVSETEGPAETQSVGPQPVSCRLFNSVSAVAMAVSTNRNTSVSPALDGLTEIYMPKLVPYGAILENIEVTSDTVTVSYGISEEHAIPILEGEEDPNRFELIWYRNWQSGSAEALARLSTRDEFLTCVYDVWMIREFTSLNRAIWEADGSGFELIIPSYYPENEDILGFTEVTKVAVDKVNDYSPSEGFVINGYMWIRDREYGVSPVNSFAYGTTYCEPQNGNAGGMLAADGLPFTSGITSAMLEFPRVDYHFEPVFLDDTTLGSITVYDVKTLEPIASNISLDELRDFAELDIDPDLAGHITADCYGSVLVDMIVIHQKEYISALDEYEIDAYHCGFILDCGY